MPVGAAAEILLIAVVDGGDARADADDYGGDDELDGMDCVRNADDAHAAVNVNDVVAAVVAVYDFYASASQWDYWRFCGE